MQDFTNSTIDITTLPRIEEVVFSKLHPGYWKVILINWLILFLIGGVGLFFAISSHTVQKLKIGHYIECKYIS